MTRTIRGLVAACCVLGAALPAAAQQEEAATRAAGEWLALVDSAAYAASWEAAARSFQAAVTAEAWSAQLTTGRAQVGKVQTRNLVRSESATNPPGAPPGEYVQLQYDSQLETLGPASEVVVLVRDGDRGWRVAGYFLRPPGG